MISWQAKLVKLFLRTRYWRQKPGAATTIEKERQELEKLSGYTRLAARLNQQQVQVTGIPGEWVWFDDAEPGRVVLYLHGGAYMVGSINTHRALASNIARVAQAHVLLINYRLAPEHPFPAALEDATAVYHWLLSNDYNPQQITLAGDSAGGGLTLATLLTLRDAGDPLPAAAVCLSPWTDLAGTGDSLQSCAKADPWLDPSKIVPTAARYLGQTDPCHPLASPLYANLAGLPPLLIQTGTAEILLSDATRLADKARQAGVEVTLEVWEGMIHVWQAFAHLMPEGRAAIDNIGVFIRWQMLLQETKANQPEQHALPLAARQLFTDEHL